MKISYLTILYVLLGSCQNNMETVEANYPDTIDIEFTHFFIDEPRDTFKQQLVKKFIGDTIYYQYYDKEIGTDDNFAIGYKFIQKDNGLLELIEDPAYQLVDTLDIRDKDKNYRLMKYEVVNPPADGDGAILFSQEYGKMAEISYDWLLRDILTKWDGKEIDKDVVLMFSSDSIARKTK